METPYKLVFELVLHHQDYIEFTVSYYLDYNQWTAEGIGWKNNGVAAYYLRGLRLNNYPASIYYRNKADLVERDLSLRFQNQALENLTLTNIKNQFKRKRRECNLISIEKQG